MVKEIKEKYLHYPSERDVVFILGAGASHPDGVPLQRHILPMIISGKIKEIENSEIGKIVKDFIKDNFKYDTAAKKYPQLEAVFGFLDYFIQQDESLSIKYTNSVLRDIREYLIKLLHYIVNLQSDKKSKYYHLFWNLIQRYNQNVSIITLNYDTLLERAFEFLFKKVGYIDYSIHLMNYDKTEKLKNFNYWVNPREPVVIEGDVNPVPFKILKIHGSLTWKYCNCCNQILLTPWDKKIDLNKGKFLGYTWPDNIEYEYQCPVDGTDFQTLIMPPSYVKSLNHPVITHLLSESSREIRASKKIVFIGYSLSDSDVHIKALFKKNISNDKKIIVVNPKPKENLELNYLALSGNTEFIYRSFEDLVQDEGLMKKILK